MDLGDVGLVLLLCVLVHFLGFARGVRMGFLMGAKRMAEDLGMHVAGAATKDGSSLS